MIDLTRFGYDESYQQLYDTVWEYSRAELHPLTDRMDRDDWFPEEKLRGLDTVGLLGATVPEQFGGQGLSFLGQCVIAEAMTYWNHSFCASYLASENVCVNSIVRNGSKEQHERFLPRFCNGELLGALGMTEAGAGSDAFGGMRTTAVNKGDHYVINGRKAFITNGPVADVILLYAKTDMDQGNGGVSAFIFETKTPGFSCGALLDKMGWRGSPTGELIFEDCEVPAENLIGKENQGVAVATGGLNLERLVLSFYNVGAAQRAMDLSVDYAKSRRQFGRAIGDFQLVQGMLADSYTDLESARAMTYQVARELEEDPARAGSPEMHKRSAAAMLHSARAAMRIFDNAVQIHGGTGFIRETEVNQLYRSGKLLEIGAGTVQIRQSIIAQQLLR